MSFEIYVNTSPYNIKVKTKASKFIAEIHDIYPVQFIKHALSHSQFYDYTVSFQRPFLSLKDSFAFKLGTQHFRYAKEDSMLPVFEWGFNWLVSSFSCRFLCIHAAVVEKNNITLILPAPPGSGKSTMCALLMLAGWRLLSDEHCLLDLDTLEIVPFVRPISLKNNSIQVMQRCHPEAKASRIYEDTLKGRMQYLAPTELSWQNYEVRAQGRYVIFPKFQHGASLQANAISEAELFERILKNSFNYSVLGERGFHAVVDWLPQLKAYDFTYSDNQAMLDWVENLV